MEFVPFPKIARLSRNCVITEKIDGTNAQVCIRPASEDDFIAGMDTQVDGLYIRAGSRTQWIAPNADGKTTDNFGFARWVWENAHELAGLDVGHHFGEWWGAGIQRKYGLDTKRFSLFNTHRWSDDAIRPACCSVVPRLYEGVFTTYYVTEALSELAERGSRAAPGFMDPEGVIVYHQAGGGYFKKTLSKDDEWKGKK